ncbi:hypothetical protein BKA00_006259 [Actinomadura coerulea]|uniref:DUF2867 domain-containing protein n=1 Tax=Actinomadura coerulea TaxID=46159 RepID=A0A7X0L294_9ACTN|nr:DUF2867 domain-containing protein [Actinomadura coerulea]MBB6399345.1 hypothetical protein [Actinomadura coerulea]GGQ28247.1 hypothetical protein GCM10010187_51180 [Actinomadura coerulea]
MKLPASAHTDRPWRIHEITPDFRLEDVWALPVTGGPDDFPKLLEQMTSSENHLPGVAGVLFAIRWRLGRLLGWDKEDSGLDGRVPSLRERLPDDLRGGPAGPAPRSLPFRPLYLTGDEWAAEMANRTVHGVMHIAWVPDGSGGHRAHMAVLVKPNGLLGKAYMAAILPFRYTLVYPTLMRTIGRAWKARETAPA